ncbi:hypothetical protein JTB14_002982 [Gonioctena quinquepunctata]|nr:hypothetical protein JTB14_002982 [Gonioctena quinquepunctata]
MKAIGRDPSIEKLSHGNVICEEHFIIDDFITSGGKKRLKHDAVPRLKLGPRKPLSTLQNLTLGVAEVSLPSIFEQEVSNKENIDFQNSNGDIQKGGDVQCAQLLTLIGEDGVRIYNMFSFTEEEKDKLTMLIDKLDKHFNAKKNLTYQRHKFLTCQQREGESIEQYITELKNLAIGCELGNLQDGLIKDILIC